jgi:hypothetical protein
MGRGAVANLLVNKQRRQPDTQLPPAHNRPLKTSNKNHLAVLVLSPTQDPIATQQGTRMQLQNMSHVQNFSSSKESSQHQEPVRSKLKSKKPATQNNQPLKQKEPSHKNMTKKNIPKHILRSP